MPEKSPAPSAAVSPDVCTIVSKNYLAHARTLAESVRRYSPASRFFVLLVDRIDGYFDPKREPFEVIEIETLAIPNLPRFCFQYDVLELNTAAKPYFLEHLFEVHKCRSLLYFDPDIVVMHSLERLGALLGEHSIVLTPHITAPYKDEKKPTHLDISRAGAFNLGFLGLSEGPATRRMLRWWSDLLYTGCKVDFERGFFVDQKWMDLVPGLFEGVHVHRDPGCNVAYWNLDSRTIRRDGERVYVNEGPCTFFHFSGYDVDRPQIVSKHQTRLTMASIGEARELYRQYGDLLAKNGLASVKHWPYSFGSFSDGTPITREMRGSYWELGDVCEAFGDPFDVRQPGCFRDWFLDPSRTPPAPAAPWANRGRDGFGVNVVGYFQSEKGVGEGSRAVVRALDAAGVPHVLVNLVDSGSENRVPPIGAFTDESPYPVNLLHFNADQVEHFVRSRGPSFFEGRYNIGFWNWELEEFPAEWRGAFEPLDEVWTPSTFSQQSIAASAPIPVLRMPYPISEPILERDRFDRGRFGLPKSDFLFLFAFDFHSFMERKNPIAVVRAFTRAFPNGSGVGLVLKTTHAKDAPEGERELAGLCAGRRDVHRIDAVLSREEMHGLTATCDAYVSLHRSEGFGLPLAEAMALGKPVIATRYSSNTDFMRDANSLGVDYRRVAITEDHGPYRRGAYWAEPDLEHAAAHMRRLVADRDFARQLGQRARQDILAEHDARRVGERYAQRLRSIWAFSREASSANAVLPTGRTSDGFNHARIQDLERRAKILSLALSSHRKMLGWPLTTTKRLFRRLMRPTLDQQVDFNEAMIRALSDVWRRVEENELRLAELEADRVPEAPPVQLRIRA